MGRRTKKKTKLIDVIHLFVAQQPRQIHETNGFFQFNSESHQIHDFKWNTDFKITFEIQMEYIRCIDESR